MIAAADVPKIPVFVKAVLPGKASIKEAALVFGSGVGVEEE